MARKFLISDIHGHFTEFNFLLKKVKFDINQDEIIIIGDCIDRGPKSYEMMCWLYDNIDNPNLTNLLGNHEQMMLLYLDKQNKDYFEAWGGIHFGGDATIKSYKKKNNKKEFLEIYNECDHDKIFNKTFTHYIDSDNKLIYAHAGINPKKHIDLQNLDDLLWIREEFTLKDISKYTDYKVVFGHTPTHCFCKNSKKTPYGLSIYEDDHKLGIDTGGCFNDGMFSLVEAHALTNKKSHLTVHCTNTKLKYFVYETEHERK